MSKTITLTSFCFHGKRLFKLALPIFITLFCQSGLGLVDAAMAGRLSALDLSAVAVGSGIWLPIFLLINGVLMATTPLIGEAIGRDVPQQIPYITQQALWSGLGLGIIACIIVNITPSVFPLLKVTENIRPIASEYLYYISIGFPAMALYAVLRCYCEAFERPTPVTIISIIGLLANIPLNYIFVYGAFGMPMLGGAGCGVASAIVVWLNLVLLVVYLTQSSIKEFVANRFFKDFVRPHTVQIKKFLYLGMPIGIAIFFEASLFSFASIIVSPLGELATASHQIALSTSSQLFMIPLSISTALTIMIANRYGEGNFAVLQEVMFTGLICTIAIAVFSMIFIWIFHQEMAMTFSTDVQVQNLAMLLLLFAGGYQLFDAIQVTVNGILRGIQDTKATMFITFVCYWLITLPLGIYLVHYTPMEVTGFWLALIIGLGLGAVGLSIRLRIQYKRLQYTLQ